tara:strand:+ start:310 stop:603 length:294 start_codon:yes stop_codon:yes gene_type:complete
MVAIMFYSLLAYGLAIAIKPFIDELLLFIRNTWDMYQEWDKKRIKRFMDAYHRGEGNYEYYDPDKDKEIWDKELMEADYEQDKYDDPFYIEDDNKKE